MKKTLVLTLCAILIPVLVFAAEKPKSRSKEAPRSEAQKVTKPTFKVLASEVNDVMVKGEVAIMDYPADDAPERGYAQDETLKVLAETRVEKTKWYKIRQGSLTGWIKAKDVITLKDKPKTETAAIHETKPREIQSDDVQKIKEIISNVQFETSIAQKELAKSTAMLETLIEKKSKLESRLFVEEQLGNYKQGKNQQEAVISGLNSEIKETVDDMRARKEELLKLQAQRKEITDTINRLSEMTGTIIGGKQTYNDTGKAKDHTARSAGSKQSTLEILETDAPQRKAAKEQDTPKERKAGRSAAMQTVKAEDRMDTNKKGFKDLLNRKGERAYSKDIGKFTIARDGDIVVIKTDMSQVTNVETNLKGAIVLKFFEDDGAYFVLNRNDSPLK